MSLELEINLKFNGKILYGHAPINEKEFEQLKRQDRWDLERYLRQILTELGHGLTNQIYLHDEETVIETIKSKVSYAPERGVLNPDSEDITRLIESLPLITHEYLIGNPDGIQEG